jgi:hypothetical protein
MVTKHLTDDEVQLYVVDKQHCETRIAEHIHLCEECRSKVEVYLLLITKIKQQPQPSFDFDLSASVLKQLSVPQAKVASDELFTWILVFVSVGFLATVAYYFRSYMTSMFEGVATILIYLIAISAITVVAGLFFEMYKKYRKEMKVLDLY